MITSPANATDPVDLIERLVAFDTTSHKSNLDLMAFVVDYLEKLGVKSTLIHDTERRKANLFASIGPAGDGGIVLSGHSDVVPVDGQDWSSDPFRVERRGSRLYGRGTADMKSFIACALAMAPAFCARALTKPVHFAFSYDEETGCFGVPGLIEHIRAHGINPDVVIVGEPTSMKVVNAHKGCRAMVTIVTGLEAHSSATHKGVNAIVHAAELIGFLAELAEDLKDPAARNSRFDPPYSTIQIGVVQGGTAGNIVPKSCRFRWEIRALPDADEDAIVKRFEDFAERTVLAKMRKVHAGAAIVTETRAAIPPLMARDGSPAETLVMALAETNQTHAVSYGTEGGIFQRADMPAVVCGPGSILNAHIPDEYIELADVEACMGFLGRLLDQVLSPQGAGVTDDTR